MKKTFLFLLIASLFVFSACTKDNDKDRPDGPRTSVPSDLQGTIMYGNFSLAEYWSQNPHDYLGNALEFALAFQFEANGNYTQYFTSQAVTGGIVTYQQAITHGTVEINEATKTIKTHPSKSRYKRTRNGQVLEERDLRDDEISSVTYHYTTGTEPNGTKAVYLTLGGTNSTLTFLRQ